MRFAGCDATPGATVDNPSMPARTPLFGLTLDELGAVAGAAGLPAFGAKQLAHWLYRRHATDLAAMTNLSRAVRERLAATHVVGRADPLSVSTSADGTRKYLFAAGAAGLSVEAALIPDRERATLCLSTQIGCRRACRFCATGRKGFKGDLTAGDILNQYASLPEREAVTNLVFMGMGEPLDNADAVLRSLAILTAPWGYGMSPSRLTVSTVGILPALERLIAETRAHIALSLHSPFPDQRRELMPVERQSPLADVLAALRRAGIRGQRRVMIEYTLLAGVNDTPEHARELLRVLRGLTCRVNLIPYNAVPGTRYRGSPRAVIEDFQRRLLAGGQLAHIRRTRGADIAAACGLLATVQGGAPGAVAAPAGAYHAAGDEDDAPAAAETTG